MLLACSFLLFIIENLQNERKMQTDRIRCCARWSNKNTELAIAAEIQKSFLPDTITQIEVTIFRATSVMAKEVGGDFCDVIPLEIVSLGPGKLGIMIADVSGKGIPAALFMALSRIVVRVNAIWYASKPAHAIRDANTIIANDSKSGMFVTLFYGILDSTSRTFTYVNAGHNPPLHFRASDGTLSELEATGIAMGVLNDAEIHRIHYRWHRAISSSSILMGLPRQRMHSWKCLTWNDSKRLSMNLGYYRQKRLFRKSSPLSKHFQGISRSRMILPSW
jgi:hypothetical protein